MLKQRIWPIAVIIALIIYLGFIMSRGRATKTAVESSKQSPKNLLEQKKNK